MHSFLTTAHISRRTLTVEQLDQLDAIKARIRRIEAGEHSPEDRSEERLFADLKFLLSLISIT